MQIDPNKLILDIKVQDKFRELLSQRGADMPKIVGVMLGDSDIDYNLLDVNRSHILNAPFNTNRIKYPLVYSGSGRGMEGRITCFARRYHNAPASGYWSCPLGQTYVPASGSASAYCGIPGATGVGTFYPGIGWIASASTATPIWIPGSTAGETMTSMYGYPVTTAFTPGTVPPSLNNGFDWNLLPFDTEKQGYVLFFQTLLLNYYDATTNLQKRLNEPMSMKVTFNGSNTVPSGWEVTFDHSTTPILVGEEVINMHHNSMLISKQATGVSTVGANVNGQITVTGLLSNITKNIAFNI